jgi:ligand-binding SRPBCC domain-containing protein
MVTFFRISGFENFMTSIYLETLIHADPETCYDLSRSIDLHKDSNQDSNEKAVAGRTGGLIEKGEYVTWEATHFFIRQRMTVKIVEMKRPVYFKDEMVSGPFRSMNHRHEFMPVSNGTLMRDEFFYEVPFGFAGRLFNLFVLRRHMTVFLVQRNELIKQCAEGKNWKKFVHNDS